MARRPLHLDPRTLDPNDDIDPAGTLDPAGFPHPFGDPDADGPDLPAAAAGHGPSGHGDFDFHPGQGFGFHHGHGGTIAAGGGTLTLAGVSTAVTTPITFGDGDYTLLDNEAGAVITGGNGNDSVTEIATGATITLGNGDMTINAPAGGAIVTAGTGDMAIALGGTGNSVTVGPTNGGTADVTFIRAGSGDATVIAGDGNMIISAAGANNSITVGTGNDIIHLNGGDDDEGSTSITASSLTLGDGTNLVFLEGNGDTIRDGAGTDRIMAVEASNERFVVNAAGGTIEIAGFTTTNGDVLDLSAILAGAAVAANLSNLGDFVTLATAPDSRHAAWTDTTLTITGPGATASVTLVNAGTLALADLIASHSVIA